MEDTLNLIKNFALWTIGIVIALYIFLPDKSESINEEYESDYSNNTSYSPTSEDHNCSDFVTQRDAQDFYIANGGPSSDPHDLDRDNDGMACDWNP